VIDSSVSTAPKWNVGCGVSTAPVSLTGRRGARPRRQVIYRPGNGFVPAKGSQILSAPPALVGPGPIWAPPGIRRKRRARRRPGIPILCVCARHMGNVARRHNHLVLSLRAEPNLLSQRGAADRLGCPSRDGPNNSRRTLPAVVPAGQTRASLFKFLFVLSNSHYWPRQARHSLTF
jgi:hypothetical protein